VLKVLAISHLLQQNLIFVLGSMQPEFKLTLPRSESILDYCAMQPLAWFLHKFIGAWMLSAERSHLVLTFSCHHVQRCRRTCGGSVDCSLQQDITKSLPKSLGRPRFYTRYRVCHFQWQQVWCWSDRILVRRVFATRIKQRDIGIAGFFRLDLTACCIQQVNNWKI
jgi:hypothetical protein